MEGNAWGATAWAPGSAWEGCAGAAVVAVLVVPAACAGVVVLVLALAARLFSVCAMDKLLRPGVRVPNDGDPLNGVSWNKPRRDCLAEGGVLRVWCASEVAWASKLPLV